MNVVLFFLYAYCRTYHILHDVCATFRGSDVCILCRLCTQLMVYDEAIVNFLLTPIKKSKRAATQTTKTMNWLPLKLRSHRGVG
jgi:hypothetical protein